MLVASCFGGDFALSSGSLCVCVPVCSYGTANSSPLPTACPTPGIHKCNEVSYLRTQLGQKAELYKRCLLSVEHSQKFGSDEL